jgi:hypothetical protein
MHQVEAGIEHHHTAPQPLGALLGQSSAVDTMTGAVAWPSNIGIAAGHAAPDNV